MKHYYKHVLTGLVAATSLASCNRAEYSFQSGTGAYHTPKTSSVGHSTLPPAPAVPEVMVTPAKVSAPSSQLSVVGHRLATPSAPTSTSTSATPAARLALLPQAAVTKAASKLSQQLQRKSEITRARKGKSGVGTAAIVLGIGLLVLLIGGLIGGTNVVATIGGVTFLVGLIMLIIALIKG